jgi:hypothetical protein
VTSTDAPVHLTLETLERLAFEVRAATLHNTGVKNSCIYGSRLASLVLSRLGHASRLQPVWISVFNAEARRKMDRGVAPHQWPPSAWSVGVNEDHAATPDGWNGHLVVVLRHSGSRVLIDVTADQFDVPARGIVLGSPIVVALPADRPWTPMDPLWLRVYEPDTSTSIRPMSPGSPAAKSWRETPDAQISDEKFEGLVDAVISRLSLT